jgi:hypothetical protein
MSCGHKFIKSARWIVTDAAETEYDMASGTRQHRYLCPKCAAPRENGVIDFCMDSVLHKVLRARKLTPLDEKRIMTI